MSSRRHLSGVTHMSSDSKSRCKDDDTRTCVGKIEYPFLDLLKSTETPFEEDSVFFVGPKTTADKYGLNKNNSEVVRHRVPSRDIYYGEKSKTDHRFVDLYQIPRTGGVTITFRTKKETKLVDIGQVENGKSFIEWATNNRPGDDSDDYEFSMVFDHSCYQRACYLRADKKIERNSTYEYDSMLVKYVKDWCASLSPDIDGFFWGGSHDCPDACEGLVSQEFCFFKPSDVLEFVAAEGPEERRYDNLPTFEEFFEDAAEAEDEPTKQDSFAVDDEKGFTVFRHP